MSADSQVKEQENKNTSEIKDFGYKIGLVMVLMVTIGIVMGVMIGVKSTGC